MPDQLPIATVRIWYDSVIEKYFVNKVKFPASSTPSSLIRLLYSPSSSNSSVLTYLLTYLLFNAIRSGPMNSSFHFPYLSKKTS